MARGIWQGTISFGLVEIPVMLLPAEKPNELDLTMLDKHDFSPIGYMRFNKRTRKEVPWNDIVRGYEYEKGEYVVLGDEDLKQANPQLTKTVEIDRFVDPKDVEPAFFEKPYYLAPLRKRSKGYVLLREALKRTKTVGVARIAIRTREHIALVGVRGNVLTAYLLRYPSEIRPASDVEGAGARSSDVGIQPRELTLAVKLVEDMTGAWNPKDYEDRYANDVKRLVRKKVAAGNVHEIAEPEEEERPRKEGKLIDLMPLLKQSLERGSRSERGKVPTRRRSAPRTRAATSHGKRSKRSA